MNESVLLDTSFLISLFDHNRTNHGVAKQYYKMLLSLSVPLYFSTIVAAEFAVKQSIEGSIFPRQNFRTLPFNVTHSIEAARIWDLLNSQGGRDTGDDRQAIKDDLKIMAQAVHEKIPFILTEDDSTLYKYCERLRTKNNLNIRAIKLSDGYNFSVLRSDGQMDIDAFA